MTRRILLGSLLIAGLAPAIGPVGQYLGYFPRLQAVSNGWSKDSVHLTLPTPMDSVVNTASQDTTVLDSEFTYNTLPGYLFRHNTWASGNLTTSTDTSYESTGVCLKLREAIGDSHRSVSRYKIPLAVDSSWSTGAAGLYPVDFGSNDTIDTVTIWADTARVVGQEDVTTPYGFVPGCYKIVSTSHWCVVTWLSGVPMRDSMIVTDVQWYKDSLWQVRDSADSRGAVSVRLFNFWLRAGSVVTTGVTELVSVGLTGFEERNAVSRSPNAELQISPNPFHSSCRLDVDGGPAFGPRQMQIYDRVGRCVYVGPEGSSWRPRGLPAGVFEVVVLDRHGCVAHGPVVYLR